MPQSREVFWVGLVVDLLQQPFKDILISNFLEIDSMIKTTDKNPRLFDLQEIIFKCELNMYK